jgi:hypothetical protein
MYFVHRPSSLFTNVPGEGHSLRTFSNYHYPTFNMEIQYPNNDHKTMITYMRSRTGPNCFRVYYKNSCVIRFTPKEVGRVFGIAKFTPSVNLIRDWCKEMVEKYESRTSLNDVTDTTNAKPNTMDTHDDNNVSSVSSKPADMSHSIPLVT